MKNQQNIENLMARLPEVVIPAMQEAIEVIRREAVCFITENKTHYDGKSDDLVTSADKAAQAVYETALRAAFPEWGLIGEEGLRVPCTIGDDEDIYFTIDPLDSTKGFARGQAHGIGTMVGLVRNGVAVAGFVGDVNSGDIWYVVPGAPVKRIRFGQEVVLGGDNPNQDLSKQYLMMNDTPYLLPPGVDRLLRPAGSGGLFKNLEIAYGGFGVRTSRLLNGEDAADIFKPRWYTPWDDVPVSALLHALGFYYFWIDRRGVISPEPCELEVRNVPYEMKGWRLIARPDTARQIREWLAAA